jgi:predicted ester cyclase
MPIWNTLARARQSSRRGFLSRAGAAMGALVVGSNSSAAASPPRQPTCGATRQSTATEHQRIVRRFVEEFRAKGNLAAADDTADPRIQGITGLKPSGPIDGPDEYKQIIALFADAFPPVEPLAIVDQFSAGNRVVTRFRARQRHVKDFLGLAASNRVVLFDETHVARLRDGKIIENIVGGTGLEFAMLMAPVLAPMILK